MVFPSFLHCGRRRFLRLLLLLSLLLPWVFVTSAQGEERPPHIMQFRLEGIIDDTAAGYVERAMQRAESEGATLVLMTLDTPGGLDGAMRRIVQALLNSKVPTAVYVSPSGARAASAGVFVVAAANVAAMAPGTNLGAAHPVSTSGELPPTLSEKATNDAAALVRGIAAQRGRNAQWLEDAVRRSVAATAQEARELGVIDIAAATQEDLLAQIDGRAVETAEGSLVLQTRGLEVHVFQMNWPERLLRVLANPDLAFVLLAIGALGILVEFLAPGHVVPGVVGALMLLVGFVALGSLPVNWAGVALLVLGIALLVVEALTPGFGAFGVAGVAAFVLGAFFLFTPFTPTAPTLPQGGIRVSRWLIGVVSAVVFAVFGFYLSAVIRARRATPVPGVSIPVGAGGVATSDLAPRGTVQAASELWTAEAVGNEPVRQGENVEVVGVEGLVLKVRKAGQPTKQPGGGP